MRDNWELSKRSFVVKKGEKGDIWKGASKRGVKSEKVLGEVDPEPSCQSDSKKK